MRTLTLTYMRYGSIKHYIFSTDREFSTLESHNYAPPLAHKPPALLAQVPA